ncbi:DUF4262 domain-containing protein [Streptomyces sp. SID13666]|uniref:DUF4262 domain-containing protein n=1 Tax=Streptomyces sp. SID13666 TaxID=2706054 RepID=UPI0013C21412|nr:DUF4262 domain-containing protein [Streptomyces sp. SID13666]NEA53532.1 DUF4262 domain-containing protein [Streptomyces sp. SID13666]
MSNPLDDTQRIIAKHGHTVRWIFDPEGQEQPFAYTVGLCARPGRAYELAAAGLPYQHAVATLNGAAHQLHVDGLDPVEGLELDEVLIGYAVRLRQVKNTTGFTAMRELYGWQPPTWQVLVPDVGGRFPGEHDYDQDPAAQPLL